MEDTRGERSQGLKEGFGWDSQSALCEGKVPSGSALGPTNWSENGTLRALAEFVCFPFLSKVDFKTPNFVSTGLFGNKRSISGHLEMRAAQSSHPAKWDSVSARGWGDP